MAIRDQRLLRDDLAQDIITLCSLIRRGYFRQGAVK